MFGVRYEAAEGCYELLLWIWDGIAQMSVVSLLCTEAHSRRGLAKHESKCEAWTKMPAWDFWWVQVCIEGHDLFSQHVLSVCSVHLTTGMSLACA